MKLTGKWSRGRSGSGCPVLFIYFIFFTVCFASRISERCIYISHTRPASNCHFDISLQLKPFSFFFFFFFFPFLFPIRRWQKTACPEYLVNVRHCLVIIRITLASALWADRGGTVIVDRLCVVFLCFFKRGSMKRGATTTCREAFVKCASRGTVILKGESAENKSTQQSWPTFMLECFQRQQSLFSYAINCLNRLPVEFLMCYKFRVCFPWVDSTQAYCVRPCPVISAGLGRTSTAEKKPVHALSLSLSLSTSVLKLNVFLALAYCAQLGSLISCHNGIYPLHLRATSMAFCNV